MNEHTSNEIWQIEVNGQVYEADFAEMTQWIGEGALQPEDKVRKGNLRWIEARKVPTLVAFFNAKATGVPLPPVVATTNTEKSTGGSGIVAETSAFTVNSTQGHVSAGSGYIPTGFVDYNVCRNHPAFSAKYVCLSCEGVFCKECTKSFGSNVILCGACGGMCRPKSDIEAATGKAQFRSAAISQGFGFSDFAAAWAYPFKFKTTLIVGAVMFMFFSLGQSASSFGGIYMVTASIFSYMLANMLTFGILANTVESFAHGRIGENFMPAFEDFSLWDDVIHPFFLSLGAYASSFGAFFLLAAIGVYLVVSTFTSQADTARTELEQTPGTPYYNVRDTVDQSNDVRGVLGNTARLNQQRLDDQEALENGDDPAPTYNEEEEFRQLNNMIADHRRQSLESAIGKTPATREKEFSGMISGFLQLAAPLVVLGALAFLWGAFFFPAACAVAGYTRSFTATINPLVGLDTIRRLGFDYVKILFMGLLIIIASGIVNAILALVFLAFDMPGVGNLPAKALGSLFAFYLSIVFSCVLGFAIFKASDRLHIRP